MDIFRGGKEDQEAKAGQAELNELIKRHRDVLVSLGVDPSNLADRRMLKAVFERFDLNPNITSEEIEDLGEKAEAILTVLQKESPEPTPGAPGVAAMEKVEDEEDTKMAA